MKRKGTDNINTDNTKSPFDDSRLLINGILTNCCDFITGNNHDEELKKQRVILQQAIDSSKSLIYLIDLNGCFIMVNESYRLLFNISDQQLIGNPRDTIMPKYIANQHHMNDLQVINGGKSIIVDEYNIEKDGLHKYKSEKFPVFDKEGNIIAVAGISDDITTLINTEQTLIENEVIMKKLLIASSELIDSNADISYQMISDTILDISGARYVSFNLFEKDGLDFTTVALSGVSEHIKKIPSILGFDILNRKWKHHPERAEKIKGNTITIFNSLHEICDTVIPDSITKFVEKSFNIGIIVVAQITRDNKAIGDFTLIYVRNETLKHAEMIELYANQVGLFLNRRQAEAETHKISEHYRALIENSTDGVVLLDNLYHFSYVSQTAKKIFGYDDAEILSADPASYTHPDDLGMVLTFLEKILEDPSYTPTLQYRFLNKQQQWIWVESTFSNMLSDQNVNSIVINFSVISERKQAELIMAARDRLIQLSQTCNQKELLQATLDETELLTGSQIGFFHFMENDGILTLQAWSSNTVNKMCKINNAGVHYPVNQAGVWVDCVHTGSPVIHNDYASLPHKKGMPAGHAPVIRELVVPILRGGKIVGILGIGNKDTLYDEHDIEIVRSIADLAWDIVERKRTEEEKANLEIQLLQAQRLESVGRLAGGVAHDFNNMLQAILGNAAMAIDMIPEDSPARESLEEICTAAERSAELTRQLLAFARKQTAIPKVLQLNDVVSGMLKMLNRLIGEDIKLEWLPDNELWKIKMDPTQIDQILANLCVNARDAISGIGEIIIGTVNSSFDENAPVGYMSGDFVRLTIKDTGCGMSRQMIEQIFEPFFTTKGVGEGTGLGLATVYGIVKQNNGFIITDSEIGKGTTFNIYFPKYYGESDHVKYDDKSIYPAQEKETILLVEDEPAILKLTMTMLERMGYFVMSADTPGKAITISNEYSGKIDLLITDVVMPEMYGHDLVKNILALYPQMKVLFMSGYTSDVIINRGNLEEGIYYLQKPFTSSELSARVREALNKIE